MVFQIAVEGARWPLGPAYLATVYLFLACVWPRASLPAPARWTAACGIVLLAAAVAMGTVLPVFQLPEPTGAFPIGTVTLHLIDDAREETQSGRPGERRELMVQLWYPAERSGPGQAYRTRAETSFVKEHLALVRTHAATGLPVAMAQPRYPVVFFSPAWTGSRSQNTVQVEELASHGFVVVGIDHPYSTALTVFPDGRTAKTMLGEWMDFSTEERFQECLRTAEAQVRIRAGDVRFVLDEIECLNRSDPQGLLTGRMDTSRVGIFGHSFGGAVAAEVCATDPRFKVGIDLDGAFFGTPKTKSIDKPFMVFSEGNPVPTPAQLEASTGRVHRELAFNAEDHRCIRQRLSESGGYILTIHGMSHMNFCDSPLYSPVRRLTHSGPIRPERGMEIVNAYMVAFFQANLNGSRETLLDAPSSAYPEVQYERFPGKTFAKEPK